MVLVKSQVKLFLNQDIYKVEHPSGEIMILKLARLGRTSFMTVKNKRDYL